MNGYRDIFNGPEASFEPDTHQGANSSFLAVVKGGRWVRLTDPLRSWSGAGDGPFVRRPVPRPPRMIGA